MLDQPLDPGSHKTDRLRERHFNIIVDQVHLPRSPHVVVVGNRNRKPLNFGTFGEHKG